MNKNSDYFQAIKYLLENHRCKAVITHVKSTVKSIDLLFNNKQISQKTIYLPMGISTLGIPEKSAGPQNCKTLLFTCSWHQDPNSFYLRGGVDLLVAYDKLHQEFGNSVRLILKCRIPEDLDAQYRNIIDKCQVRVVEHFLEDSELNELMASADFFMLPAARIHVISILQAMSWGKVLVTSDGWGIQEYVEHDQTAIIIPGRYGRYSCLDEKNGWLMENYALMNRHDDVFADKMFREMRILLNDPDRACRIGLNARQAVKEKFSAEVLNRNLKNIFDKLI